MTQKINKTRFTPPADWQADIINTNPIFSHLCQKFGQFSSENWPSLQKLNQWLTNEYRFVANEALEQDGRYYEDFIFATKTIPCRENNWHDFFGALIWCLFPQTKALLNQLHIQEIKLHGFKQRSLLRNKLTLFDECGVVVCLEPNANHHAELLRTHQWQHSFCQLRSEWMQRVKPIVFGHAIYEMATKPFIGLTAKSVFIDVPAGFSGWNVTDTYSFLDQMLCNQIAKHGMLYDKQQLTPLPLLGVPTWYSANEDASFYLNTGYFRPARRRT
jgi:hypothetical protein